ncbi:hypothetical protein GCM10010232_05680 [Streptomyces amakusaensis]
MGVTAGLGTANTLSWTGSRNTAPETPTGAVTTAIDRPASSPPSPSHQSTRCPRPGIVGSVSARTAGERPLGNTVFTNGAIVGALAGARKLAAWHF